MKIKFEEIKELYLSGKTLKEIAEIAECNTSNIQAHLKRNNVPRREPTDANRKYSLDERYFEVIDSEEKAYILGFFYADSYNQQSRSQIRVTLQMQDIDILQKIKSCLKITKDIWILSKKDGTQYCDITINSKRMSEDLGNKGCVQAKSLIVTFPEFLDESLKKHFIRGYFDGNGCISFAVENQLTLTSTQNMLDAIQKIFMKELDLTCNKLHQRHKETEIYTLQYHGMNKIRVILDYMYSNSTIYLDRKYNKYLSTL